MTLQILSIKHKVNDDKQADARLIFKGVKLNINAIRSGCRNLDRRQEINIQHLIPSRMNIEARRH